VLLQCDFALFLVLYFNATEFLRIETTDCTDYTDFKFIPIGYDNSWQGQM